MGIGEIQSGGLVPSGAMGKPGNAGGARKSPPKEDKVELSDEARSLMQSEQSIKADQIQRRIETGFYDRPEVREKIAEEVLKELRGQG